MVESRIPADIGHGSHWVHLNEGPEHLTVPLDQPPLIKKEMIFQWPCHSCHSLYIVTPVFLLKALSCAPSEMLILPIPDRIAPVPSLDIKVLLPVRD